jgi:hypothetical protein
MFNKITVILAVIISLLIIPLFSQADLVGNTNNATLSFSPDSGIYRVGGTFSIDILVNTHGQNVVVVAAFINYNPSIFEAVSIDTSDSVFTMEAENVIDSTNGKVKISRGSPSPGVNTTSGNVATINLRGLANSLPSSDNITFNFVTGATNESNVILDDGLGTDILSGAYNARFTLDGTAPANVSNFSAVFSDGSVSLSWTNPTTDFNGVTILRKTDSYPTSPTDGTIVYNDSGTSYLDIGLTNGLTYYYTAFSRDIVLNYSSGAQVSARPQDGVPPAAINNLAVSSFTSNSVILTWTAVGDDGNSGTAAGYDLRYSTGLITSANWNSASQVSNEPAPKVSGGSESMTVSQLSDGTTYYFVIRAIDESGNNSGLSNVVSRTTYRRADLNSDSYVNSVDFGILMSYWGSTTRPAADINQDGYVNSVDFGIMMSRWG